MASRVYLAEARSEVRAGLNPEKSHQVQLSIIIVNWKSREYLRKCVASVLAQTSGIEFEIIVIDSASFDGAGEMLAKEFPKVRFIQSQENLGFSKANNRAFEDSTGDVVLFLNPDTELVGNAINTLFDTMKSLPDAGAVGCKLLNTDGSIQTSCVQAYPTILNQVLSADAFRRLTPNSSLWGMRAIFDASPGPQIVEMISGACLMMRRDVFKKTGQFSTEYFMYAEDVDLCFKAQEAGCRNYFCGEAVVIHHGGGSSQVAPSNFSSVMMRESVWLYFKKTRGDFCGMLYRVSILISAFTRMLVLFLTVPACFFQGKMHLWRSSFGKWKAILFWSLWREGAAVHR